jgi:hypothetical protein
VGPKAQAHGDFDARENVSRTPCFSEFLYHITEMILQAMPVIHFVPVQNYLPPKENYECPLYKTNIRAGILSTTGQSTNYILNVSLPTDKDPKFWVLQGTAMVTMLND